ncbi:Eco29kI family restriction endonuclease [Stackebrandtia nassauensis]|nr:Eco29kI family restriction endonuclease [Stackebrandtia nassauensis]
MSFRKNPGIPNPERFNPLDPTQIGKLLREKLEEQSPHPFPPGRFLGAGLYAIYWVGDFPLYAPLRDSNVPVYVGKAEAGSSSYGYEPDYGTDKLWERIDKHARSVSEVEMSSDATISRADFRVRFLSLEDAWIVLGERALFREYRPVLWNAIMNGFGSNPPGGARKNARSVWDTIHPGRARAGEWPNRSFTKDEMLSFVERGIEISLMHESARREAALSVLRENRPPVIWAPAKKSDPDKRNRIFDEGRFFSEVERMGLTIDPSDYRVEQPNSFDQTLEFDV